MRFDKFIKNQRESVNISIYSTKSIVTNILRVLRFMVSLAMFGCMVYYYGFPQTDESRELLMIIFRASFVFFIVSYVIRLFYDFDPGEFIRTNKVEGLLVSVLLLNILSKVIFSASLFQLVFNQIDTERAEDFLVIFTQFYLLLIVGIEMAKASRKISLINLSPSLLFILSFILLIFGGAGLLMLPECAAEGNRLNFVDALFTSTSASCVTGLTVVDTATFFTLKGKLVLMLLIQLGGLNVISFATFFAAFGQKGVSLRHKLIIKDFMSYENLENTSGLLKRVILMTIFIELAGAVLIFFTWGQHINFDSWEQKVFHSLFHSISAFNNAGFSTFTNNLYEPVIRQSYLMHIVIALLVFLGGLGVPIMNDLFGLENLRKRMKFPWKKLTVTTRLSVYTSLILIVLGAIGFYLFESVNYKQYVDGNLMDQSFSGKLITSFFQSVITRTAGFNSVDTTVLTNPTLLFFIFLMFVGASSGGTGGGIKTSTFAIIFLSAISIIRGKKNVEVFRQNLSFDLLNRAFSILLFSLSIVFFGTMLLAFTEPDIDPLKLAFEEVSAFATVGLSAGITTSVSDPGKIILVLSMLIGRVGVLTLAFALSRKAITNNYRYPNAYVMVG